jgi:CubicO group peptidase (beta-lactamase class C family)
VVCRVEQAGVLRFQAAYGWIDPDERSSSVRLDSLFDLASLTKLFTTTAFLRLVDAGQAALDQPVVDVIPEFGGWRPIGAAEDPLTKEPLPPDSRWRNEQVNADRITFRQLLTHSSGLPAWRSLYADCGPPPGPSDYQDREEIRRRQACGLAQVVRYPFIYPPGAGYTYSDIGLILLGYAVARLHGSNALQQAITNLVIEPLDLSVCFNPAATLHDRIVPTEFCEWRGRRLRGEVHDENAAGLGGIAGHAGLFGTVQDLCRLGNLYLIGGNSLLSGDMVAESVREQIVSSEGVRRGLGWLLPSDPKPSCSDRFHRDSFGHTGFTGTSLWCDPHRRIVVALFTNRVYHGRDPARITQFRPRVHEAIVDMLEGEGT